MDSRDNLLRGLSLQSRKALAKYPPMSRRWIGLAIAVFQAFWLNVVVPGHTRGIIQFAGAAAAQSSCPFCSGDSQSGKDSKSKEPAKPADGCAICFFAAHLTVPPPIDLTLPKMQLLHLLPDEVAEDLTHCVVFLPFDNRGPPLHFA